MQRSNHARKYIYSVQLVKQIKPGLKPGFGLKIGCRWTKNQTTRTKNKPAFALKIDAYWTKNSREGADIALKIKHSDHYI